MTNPVTTALVRAWYSNATWLLLLLPLALMYRAITALRRTLYRNGSWSSWRAPVPVVVVGNITVGGTGKTPVVIALVEALRQVGYTPGIISRGYGSKAPHYPYSVTSTSSALHAGDEPLLLAIRTQAPLVIAADRTAAAKTLLENFSCDVIISDDGLQHYALQRDIEIIVVDGERLLGNRQCLPAGPLREPPARLHTVDFIICNGSCSSIDSVDIAAVEIDGVASIPMQLAPQHLHSVHEHRSVELAAWSFNRKVHAVAGIGNPQRFFNTLRAVGFDPIEHAFSDHHHYTASDLDFGDDLPIVMTEKDAVKVRALPPQENCWCLPVTAQLPANFFSALDTKLQAASAALKR